VKKEISDEGLFRSRLPQRRGYQELLAKALADQNVEVTFPRGSRRVLPLWRALRMERGSAALALAGEVFRGAGDGFVSGARCDTRSIWR